MTKKVFSTKVLLLLIVLLALALRVYALLELNRQDYFSLPEMAPDSDVNHILAQRIASGDLLAGAPFYGGPLYLYFLSVFYALLGPNPFFPKLAQVILGSLNPLLLFWIGRKLFSEKTGLLAALGGAMYGIFIFYDTLLLKTSLSVFLLLLCISVLLLALEKTKGAYFLLAGASLGLCALIRPNLLLYVPLVMAGIFWTRRLSGLKQGLLHPALLGLGVALAISPVTLANLSKGDAALIGSNGGISFYLGNNKLARPVYRELPGISSNPIGEQRDTQRVAEKALGRKLTPSEVSSFWFRQGLRFIYHNPFDFLKLCTGKFLLSLNRLEVPNTEHFYFAQGFSTVLGLPLLGFGLILPLGLVGMFVGRERGSPRFVLDLLIVSVFFTLTLFYVSARLRVSMVPFLILYAAHAVLWAWDNLAARKYRSLVLAMAASGLLVILSFMDVYPRLKSDFLKCYENAAGCYQFLGEQDKAISELNRALESSPHNPEILELLGVSYAEQGRRRTALSFFNQALARKPRNSATIIYRRGLVFLELGDLEKAEADISKALELDPYLARANGYMGAIRRRQGRVQEAVSYLRKAVEMQPEWAMPYLELGRSYKLIEDLDKARTALKRGLALDPVNAEMRALLRELSAGPSP